MFGRLAKFAHTYGRRVLFVAVIGAAIAGAFGFGVGKHMSPYGATDPATQSVQAERRFEAAADRKIDPGIVAIVSAGDVRQPRGRAAGRAGRHPAPCRARRRECRRASTKPTTRRWSRATVARPTSSSTSSRARTAQLKDAAQRIEQRFAGQHDVRLGGEEIASAQANTQVGQDLARAELLAFPFIFLLSLLFFRSLVASLIPPLIGGLAIVVSFFALRIVSNFTDLSVFALNFVTGLGLGLAIDYSLFMVSRYREEAATSGFGLEALQRTLNTTGTDDPVQLVDGGRGRRLADDLPAAVPVLDGDRRRGGRAGRGDARPSSCSRRCWRCSARGSTPWPRSGCSAPPTATPGPPRAGPGTGWHGSSRAAPARRRPQHSAC